MKLLIRFIGLLLCCEVLIIIIEAQNSCPDRAKKVTINITDCCDFPDFFDPKILNETYDQIMAEGKATPGTPLFDCLIEQTLFKKLKLADDKGLIDGAKINSTLTEIIKDLGWRKTIINSVSKCLNESQKYAEKYQAETGIPKETCDFKYDALSDCVDVNTFLQCPESSWIKSSNSTLVASCEFVKSFVKDCLSDVSAIDMFLDKQKD